MALAGRLAIVAGGFGGIGSATGRLLRARGASIAVLYAPFEAAKAASLMEQCYAADTNSKGVVKAYECDVASSEAVSEAFQTLRRDVDDGGFSPSSGSGGAIVPSILANCAGYVSLSPLEETTAEETMQHLTSNILGPMLVSQAFAKWYIKAGAGSPTADKAPSRHPPGRIVSIASQAAHVALDKHGAYCASKAGLIGLTKCMASEWGAKGITANTISPGVVWTALGRKAWSDEEVDQRYQAMIPCGRFAEPEEVAEAVAWLCSDETGMVNGADLRLDGGFTIR